MLYPNEIEIEKPSRSLVNKVREFMKKGTGGAEMLNVRSNQTTYEFTPFTNSEDKQDFTGGWCVKPSGHFTHYIELGGNVKKFKQD